MTKTYELKTGKQVKVSASHKRKSVTWGQEHFAYTIEMSVGDEKYRTTFHDSAMHYPYGHATTQMIDSAVNCTILDADSYDHNRTFQDFCDEYGYDLELDEKNARNAFEGCREAYEALERLLTQDEMNELVEMTD